MENAGRTNVADRIMPARRARRPPSPENAKWARRVSAVIEVDIESDKNHENTKGRNHESKCGNKHRMPSVENANPRRLFRVFALSPFRDYSAMDCPSPEKSARFNTCDSPRHTAIESRDELSKYGLAGHF
jgi:hypothetical protein